MKITIDVDNLLWTTFWALINNPEVAHVFLITDPEIAHIFLKSRKHCADTSPDTEILHKLAKGREMGQVAGARTNRENAEKRRKAIIRLAKEVWERKPHLQNKMLATAREIERVKDSVLAKYGSLGLDAIRKHLSAARKNQQL